jgi:hypothetical protein
MKREDLLKMHETMTVKAYDLLREKSIAYASEDDAFANFNMAELVGVPAYRSCMTRMLEKMARISSLTEQGKDGSLDESIVDTLLDLINYTVILSGLIHERGISNEKV